MNRNEIWTAIGLEIKKDKRETPLYPDHVVAQAAMVTQASGMLTKSAIDFKYHLSNAEMVAEVQKERLFEDGVKTAVAAIRFLENLK